MTHMQRTIILGTISIVFLVTGILKILNNPLEVAQFNHWGYPLWFMYFTGVINIIASIGLHIKSTFRYSAFTLITLLLLALISIVIHKDFTLSAFHPIVLFISLFLVLRYTKE